MIIRLHPHALERLSERGATEDEVRATVLGGEAFPAKFGRNLVSAQFPLRLRLAGSALTLIIQEAPAPRADTRL